MLAPKEIKEIRSLLPIQAKLLINERYGLLLNKKAYIGHLEVNNKVYIDYATIYSNVTNTPPTIESALIRLLIIFFLMLRIWFKHK